MFDNRLDGLLNEMTQIDRDARQLVAGLSEAQLNWAPSPRMWSVALCMDHLAQTNRAFRPNLEKALAKAGHRHAARQPYRSTWMGRWLINALAPGSGRRFKAPKPFRPRLPIAPGALDRFLEEQRQIASLLQRAQGVALNVTLRSPATPLIRYSLGEAFDVIVLHDRRHLAQARRVLQHQDFPPA